MPSFFFLFLFLFLFRNDTNNFLSIRRRLQASVPPSEWNHSVERGQCTWKQVAEHKTIDLQCLVDRGIKRACFGKKLPFPQAIDLVKSAFATDDPSQGGCPSV
jgi:hypothetical protein